MKKLILVATIIAFLTGCSSSPLRLVDYVDYSPLTQEGLYVSHNISPNFAYTEIGDINITLISGDKAKFDQKQGKWIAKDGQAYTRQDAFVELAKELKKVGADGIIGLQYSTIQKKNNTFFENSAANVVISGIAIKRK